jgi:hypothetical protein
MAKATMHTAVQTETATTVVVGGATEIKYEIDSLGRNIGVIKPGALMRYRLLKMLGAENAKNEPLLGNAMLAFCVRQISNEQIMIPNSERQIEALIDRLDDPGLAAVAKCLQEQFGLGAKDGNSSDEALKN